MNNKQTIDENYEDVLFAKLMNDHAQIEGTRLMEENERLKNDPNFHLPVGLDKQCMETIKNTSKAKNRKKIGRTTVAVLKRVAVVILVCSVLFTGLMCTASAFREAVFRLFTNEYKEKTDMLISEEKPDNEFNGEFPEGVGYPTWLPEGYVLTSISSKDSIINAVYTNGLGGQILYKELPDGFTAGIDTENTNKIETVSIGECEGIFVSKGEKLSVSWGDTDNNKLVRISSKTITKKEILKIAKSVTK